MDEGYLQYDHIMYLQIYDSIACWCESNHFKQEIKIVDFVNSGMVELEIYNNKINIKQAIIVLFPCKCEMPAKCQTILKQPHLESLKFNFQLSVKKENFNFQQEYSRICFNFKTITSFSLL